MFILQKYDNSTMDEINMEIAKGVAMERVNGRVIDSIKKELGNCNQGASQVGTEWFQWVSDTECEEEENIEGKLKDVNRKGNNDQMETEWSQWFQGEDFEHYSDNEVEVNEKENITETADEVKKEEIENIEFEKNVNEMDNEEWQEEQIYNEWLKWVSDEDYEDDIRVDDVENGMKRVDEDFKLVIDEMNLDKFDNIKRQQNTENHYEIVKENSDLKKEYEIHEMINTEDCKLGQMDNEWSNWLTDEDYEEYEGYVDIRVDRETKEYKLKKKLEDMEVQKEVDKQVGANEKGQEGQIDNEWFTWFSDEDYEEDIKVDDVKYENVVKRINKDEIVISGEMDLGKFENMERQQNIEDHHELDKEISDREKKVNEMIIANRDCKDDQMENEWSYCFPDENFEDFEDYGVENKENEEGIVDVYVEEKEHQLKKKLEDMEVQKEVDKKVGTNEKGQERQIDNEWFTWFSDEYYEEDINVDDVESDNVMKRINENESFVINEMNLGKFINIERQQNIEDSQEKDKENRIMKKKYKIYEKKINEIIINKEDWRFDEMGNAWSHWLSNEDYKDYEDYGIDYIEHKDILVDVDIKEDQLQKNTEDIEVDNDINEKLNKNEGHGGQIDNEWHKWLSDDDNEYEIEIKEEDNEYIEAIERLGELENDVNDEKEINKLNKMMRRDNLINHREIYKEICNFVKKDDENEKPVNEIKNKDIEGKNKQIVSEWLYWLPEEGYKECYVDNKDYDKSMVGVYIQEKEDQLKEKIEDMKVQKEVDKKVGANEKGQERQIDNEGFTWFSDEHYEEDINVDDVESDNVMKRINENESFVIYEMNLKKFDKIERQQNIEDHHDIDKINNDLKTNYEINEMIINTKNCKYDKMENECSNWLSNRDYENYEECLDIMLEREENEYQLKRKIETEDIEIWKFDDLEMLHNEEKSCKLQNENDTNEEYRINKVNVNGKEINDGINDKKDENDEQIDNEWYKWFSEEEYEDDNNICEILNDKEDENDEQINNEWYKWFSEEEYEEDNIIYEILNDKKDENDEQINNEWYKWFSEEEYEDDNNICEILNDKKDDNDEQINNEWYKWFSEEEYEDDNNICEIVNDKEDENDEQINNEWYKWFSEEEYEIDTNICEILNDKKDENDEQINNEWYKWFSEEEYEDDNNIYEESEINKYEQQQKMKHNDQNNDNEKGKMIQDKKEIKAVNKMADNKIDIDNQMQEQDINQMGEENCNAEQEKEKKNIVDQDELCETKDNLPLVERLRMLRKTQDIQRVNIVAFRSKKFTIYINI